MTRPRADVRTDIQGLRAIAVSAVLLFHLWPKRFTGGFVGVDVFFVISGFLITSHLLAHAPRRPRDLLAFWSRRIRRLLPASLLVLLVTLIAARFVAPATQWNNTARQVKAAALYVVNWRLADDSVDYLAADNAPTAVQHFWSLSVEEQFYLGWPVLILLAVLAATLLRRRLAPFVLTALGLATAASLVYSVHLTATDPARAYFVTGTRIWELGLGGVLAAGTSRTAFGRRDGEPVPLPAPARAALAWVGLATIAVTVLGYTTHTPFPGWRALLPTVGTAAVIAAWAPMTRTSPGPLLAARPLQWLGDVSYSVYLWHWPLIVLVPYATGDQLGWPVKIAIIVASFVLAGLTKRFVEDPFRTGQWVARPRAKPFALAAAGMAVVVAAASLQVTEVQHRQRDSRQALARALAAPDSCFGAAAMAAPPGTCRPSPGERLLPDPVDAANDKSDAYRTDANGRNCFAYVPDFPVTVCRFGRIGAPTRIALVGNSHAGHWLSALEEIADDAGWEITTHLASRCAFADLRQAFPTPAQAEACQGWVHRTTRRLIAENYDLVVMANRVSLSAMGRTRAASRQPYRDGYAAVLAKLRAAGEPVLVIRDTPAPGTAVPDCLADHAGDPAACAGHLDEWRSAEPATAAVKAVGDAGVIYADLTRYFCAGNDCPAAIGRVVVYMDATHMTATYSRTLAPYLRPYVDKALAAGR